MTKKVGDLVAVTFWTKVDRVENSEKLLVEDLYNGNKFHIQGKDLINQTLSADEFDKTEKVTKTELAAKFVTLFGRPFTVCYDTQKETNRTLRGKLIEPEHLLGRSYVEDLDIPLNQHRMRQVDHRTIHWLIVDNVKYVVK
jgi:hypothetical protein